MSDEIQPVAAVEAAKLSKLDSFFVAAWRPAVGWVCASAFGWAYVIQPLLAFVFAAVGHPVMGVRLDLAGMTPALLGMLGLAGMRSYEKVTGNGGKNL